MVNKKGETDKKKIHVVYGWRTSSAIVRFMGNMCQYHGSIMDVGFAFHPVSAEERQSHMTCSDNDIADGTVSVNRIRLSVCPSIHANQIMTVFSFKKIKHIN